MDAPPRPKACTNWCFTINNPEPGIDALLATLVLGDDAPAKFVVYQGERASTPHVQGYVQWKRAKTLSASKCQLGLHTAHMEPAKGSPAENVTYCTKEDTYDSTVCPRRNLGTMSVGKGQRSDLIGLNQAILDGRVKTVLDVLRDDQFGEAWYKYHGGITRAITAVSAEKKRLIDELHPFHCVLYLGAPGAGKTTDALKFLESQLPEGERIFTAPISARDLRGYSGQSCILFDEFAGAIPVDQLKCLIDPNPEVQHTIIVPYGERNWLGRVICITSNVHPSDWYDYRASTWNSVIQISLFRRFTRVLQYSGSFIAGDVVVDEQPTYTGSSVLPNWWSRPINILS